MPTGSSPHAERPGTRRRHRPLLDLVDAGVRRTAPAPRDERPRRRPPYPRSGRATAPSGSLRTQPTTPSLSACVDAVEAEADALHPAAHDHATRRSTVPPLAIRPACHPSRTRSRKRSRGLYGSVLLWLCRRFSGQDESRPPLRQGSLWVNSSRIGRPHSPPPPRHSSPPGSASAPPPPPPHPAAKSDQSAKLRKDVSVAKIMRHLEAFQEIADANGGTRASGTDGYEASGELRRGQRLKKAGYKTERQYFPFTYTEILGEDVTENSPTARTFENHVMTGSPSTPEGGVTADLVSPAPATGCNAADWAGVDADRQDRPGPAGRLLVPHQEPERRRRRRRGRRSSTTTLTGELNGTLGDDPTGAIPTTGITQADGQALAAELAHGRGQHDRRPAHARRDPRDVQRHRGDQKRQQRDVVMLGSHLDSRRRRCRHQRQRLRLGDDPRRGRGGRQPEVQDRRQAPLRLVGRRGDRPGRLDLLRRPARGKKAPSTTSRPT